MPFLTVNGSWDPQSRRCLQDDAVWGANAIDRSYRYFPPRDWFPARIMRGKKADEQQVIFKPDQIKVVLN